MESSWEELNGRDFRLQISKDITEDLITTCVYLVSKDTGDIYIIEIKQDDRQTKV